MGILGCSPRGSRKGSGGTSGQEPNNSPSDTGCGTKMTIPGGIRCQRRASIMKLCTMEGNGASKSKNNKAASATIFLITASFGRIRDATSCDVLARGSGLFVIFFYVEKLQPSSLFDACKSYILVFASNSTMFGCPVASIYEAFLCVLDAILGN